MSRIYEDLWHQCPRHDPRPDGVRRRSVQNPLRGLGGPQAQPGGGRLPETGATTHAGVLSGAIEYLRDHGFRDISIIEGSWVGDDTGRAFRAAGYEAVGKKYGVPLFDLKRDKTRRVDTPCGPWTSAAAPWTRTTSSTCPCSRGHCQTAMTCALKAARGCLPDREKRRFHSEGLMRPIAALAAALRPELTIVDSLCGDLDFEEGGQPRPHGPDAAG